MPNASQIKFALLKCCLDSQFHQMIDTVNFNQPFSICSESCHKTRDMASVYIGFVDVEGYTSFVRYWATGIFPSSINILSIPFLRDSASVPPQSDISNNEPTKYVGMPKNSNKNFEIEKLL